MTLVAPRLPQTVANAFKTAARKTVGYSGKRIKNMSTMDLEYAVERHLEHKAWYWETAAVTTVASFLLPPLLGVTAFMVAAVGVHKVRENMLYDEQERRMRTHARTAIARPPRYLH